MKNKLFAQTISIPQEPVQIDDYVYDFTERYISHIYKTWDDFVISDLYDLYKKLGYTRILVISKEDYEKFLKWALPEYKRRFKDDK